MTNNQPNDPMRDACKIMAIVLAFSILAAIFAELHVGLILTGIALGALMIHFGWGKMPQ